MNSKAIGIFDSGVGAFSVLDKLVKVMPNEEYIYFGDSGHNPYGQKSIDELQKLCSHIVDILIKKEVKMVVIACNTATVAALEYLKLKYDLPIIGVIGPGAKEAVRVTTNGKIGVCSTVFTAKTHGYLNEIHKINDKITVYEEGSPQLASIIENGFEYNEKNEEIVKEFVTRFKDIDTLVLGCTHYPLISDLFEKYFKGAIVDPAMQTALEVRECLNKNNMLSQNKENYTIKYYVTKDADNFKKVAKNVTKLLINDITEVSIDE